MVFTNALAADTVAPFGSRGSRKRPSPRLALAAVVALAAAACDADDDGDDDGDDEAKAERSPAPQGEVGDEPAPAGDDEASAVTESGFALSDGPLEVELPPGFPPPERETDMVPVEGLGDLEIEMTMFSSYSEEHSAMVMAAHNEYPGEAFETQTLQEMLDNARDGALDNTGGDLISDEALERDGRPVREFVLSASAHGQTTLVRAQLHVEEPYLVQVMYMSPVESRLFSPMAEAYFDSLAIRADASADP